MSGQTGVTAETADVVVVGAGPSGLAAAATLARAGAGRVIVLDRETDAGGIPRHAHHQGFGIRDLHRVLPGPEYAKRNIQAAIAAGAELRTETQATGWSRDGALELTSPSGRSHIRAPAVVLATGCRERPRAARLIAGSRPQGVITTGTLQQLVYLHGQRPGRRAVILGAEHVSFSALLTLAHIGVRTVAMITERARHQTYAAFRAGAAIRFRTPLLTDTALTKIRGQTHVEAVELTDLTTGATRELPCDLVVLTADWIPDHELAVLGGATLDPGTRGPQVDPALRTSRIGLFAVGNVLHGAEQADTAALTGRQVAASVLHHLAGNPWPTTRLTIECDEPLRWITPNALSIPIDPDSPPQKHFILRANERLLAPHIEIAQSAQALWRGHLRGVTTGRSVRLPSTWTSQVDGTAEPIIVRVVNAHRQPRAAEHDLGHQHKRPDELTAIAALRGTDATQPVARS